MYYDDQARRFNFVSGLVLGALLGAGLALLAAPHRPLRRRRPLRNAVVSARREAGRGVERLRERVGETGGQKRPSLAAAARRAVR